MQQLVFITAFIFVLGCNSKTHTDPNYNAALEEVKTNMSFKEVEDLTGKPATVDDLGTATSETGDTSHLVQWYFGTNQSVLFTNGKVSGVELDIKASQERLHHIMDSAKAVEGSSGQMIQPTQH